MKKKRVVGVMWRKLISTLASVIFLYSGIFEPEQFENKKKNSYWTVW